MFHCVAFTGSRSLTRHISNEADPCSTLPYPTRRVVAACGVSRHIKDDMTLQDDVVVKWRSLASRRCPTRHVAAIGREQWLWLCRRVDVLVLNVDSATLPGCHTTRPLSVTASYQEKITLVSVPPAVCAFYLLDSPLGDFMLFFVRERRRTLTT